MSKQNWLWTCCSCGGGGYSQRVDYKCANCGHNRCLNCGITAYVSESGGHGTFSQPPSVTVISNILHLRARPRHLQLYLHEYLVNAFADSGCEINCITESYAEFLGVIIKPKVQRFKLPIKGRSLESCGSTTIKCRFPTSPPMAQLVSFVVFPQLVSTVILGMNFLSATQTLDAYTHRLTNVDLASMAPNLQIVRSLGPTKSVCCWLDGKQVQCLPDTGSEVNLVSIQFAKTLEISASGGHLTNHIDHLESTTIQFADWSTTASLGTIKITVSFMKPSQCLSSTHKLVESLPHDSGQPGDRQIPVNSKIEETFHVLDDLECSVILSESLLATVDAFNKHFRNFVSSKQRTSDSINVIRNTKRNERKAQPKFTCSEEQRIRNDYTEALDLYQQE